MSLRESAAPKESEWSAKRASRPSRAASVATWSGRGALLLQLVAVDEGVVLDHHLGDRVRERGRWPSDEAKVSTSRHSLPGPATTRVRA